MPDLVSAMLVEFGRRHSKRMNNLYTCVAILFVPVLCYS